MTLVQADLDDAEDTEMAGDEIDLNLYRDEHCTSHFACWNIDTAFFELHPSTYLGT